MKKYVLITLDTEPSVNVKDALEAISIEADVSEPKTAIMLAEIAIKLSNIEKARLNEQKLFGTHVLLSDAEYADLCKKYGQKRIDSKINDMNDYAVQIGTGKFRAKYKSHYMTIKNWVRLEELRNGRSRQNTSRVESGKSDYGQYTG